MIAKTTTAETAHLLGISRRTLDDLGAAGIIPKESRNCYDLAASIRAYIRHREEAASVTSDGGDDDRFLAARAVLYEQRARAAKVDGDLRSGQSHDAEAISFFMGQAVASSRAKLLSIPNACAAAVADISDPEACRAILDEACREAAIALSEYDPAAVVRRYRSTSGQPVAIHPAEDL